MQIMLLQNWPDKTRNIVITNWFLRNNVDETEICNNFFVIWYLFNANMFTIKNNCQHTRLVHSYNVARWHRGRAGASRPRGPESESRLGRNFSNFQFFSFFLSFTGRRIVFPLPGDLKSLIFSRLLQRVTSDMVYSIHMQRTYDRKNNVHGYRKRRWWKAVKR